MKGQNAINIHRWSGASVSIAITRRRALRFGGCAGVFGQSVILGSWVRVPSAPPRLDIRSGLWPANSGYRGLIFSAASPDTADPAEQARRPATRPRRLRPPRRRGPPRLQRPDGVRRRRRTPPSPRTLPAPATAVHALRHPDEGIAMTSNRTVRIDRIACTGHGQCAEPLPELITPDGWGYPILHRTAIPPDLRAHARATPRVPPTRPPHRQSCGRDPACTAMRSPPRMTLAARRSARSRCGQRTFSVPYMPCCVWPGTGQRYV